VCVCVCELSLSTVGDSSIFFTEYFYFLVEILFILWLYFLLC